MKMGSPSALGQRLRRAEAGVVHSALDEFLVAKTPIQFGGMSDPFGPIENKQGVALEFLKVLSDRDYPFMISTKSDLPSDENYLSVLKDCRTLVRFSITATSADTRSALDGGTPDRRSIYSCIDELSSAGIQTAVRIQPILPGHEDTAYSIIDAVAAAGAKHVSLEYMKLPIETGKTFNRTVELALGEPPKDLFNRLGGRRLGRETILSSAYRYPRLLDLGQHARNVGLTVGFADNDLLHMSDGNSCCNGMDLHVPSVSVFSGNILGAINKTSPGDILTFESIEKEWMPLGNISTYLNSKSRILSNKWSDYASLIWNGRHGIYRPDYFFGIVDTGRADDLGHIIYSRLHTVFD